MGGWEVPDGVEQLVRRHDTGVGDLQPCEQDGVLAELEFFFVEDDPVPSAEIQELADLEEVCLDVWGPQCCVIHTSDEVSELAHDCVQPFIVPITAG